MELGIHGRVALVGGASQGIGRAVAEVLVAEGAQVVITARDPARTAEVAAEIGAAAGLAWDSANLDAAPGLVARIAEELGPVDILVTNTGGPPADPDPLNFTTAQWEQAHRTLVLAPMTMLRLVVPGMRERGWGRVVGIASTTVREPIQPLILSNAERSAQLAAYKTMAREVAGDGVTINSLLTGGALVPPSAWPRWPDRWPRPRPAPPPACPQAGSAVPRRWHGRRRSCARSAPPTSPARRSPWTAERCAGSDATPAQSARASPRTRGVTG